MRFKKSLLAVALSAYLVSSSGCGVLLYPERQGQTGGKVDPAVLILNGIGLLIFIPAGAVAFIIDFHQGTIYLPNNGVSYWDESSEVKTVQVDGPMTEENIRAALEQALGVELEVKLTDSQVRMEVVDEQHRLMPLLARAQRMQELPPLALDYHQL